MSEPWYQDGLRFACTQCGRCCTGEPGNVWVSDDELDVIAERLGLSYEQVVERYTVERRRGRSLTEKSNNDCVFWARGQGCTIYDVRPKQCRTWPFWRSNLASEEDWDDAASDCPGINRGELHDAESITRIASDDGLPR